MGVYGLWRLIEPSGKPVPLETLENKVLAIDVSIWLHQAIKGFQDSKGASIPNAHLLGIYHRVCKLLYFKIKPVFVFDGGVPALKKQTIAKRNQLKSKNLNQANSIQQKLLATLLKHSAVTKVLSEKTRAQIEQSTTKNTKPKSQNDNREDLFQLPPMEISFGSSSEEEESFQESSATSESSPSKHWDLHTIDVKSAAFKNLPPDVRHEILTDLKETRKQNSWGRLHELPTQSDDFAGFQMNRLLNRFSVQKSLDEAADEMGGHSLSLAEMEALLKDTGVISAQDLGKRIASNENEKLLYIKDLKNTMNTAKLLEEHNNLVASEGTSENIILESGDEAEFEKDLETAIKLSTKDSNLENDDPKLVAMERNKTTKETEFERDISRAIQLSLQEEPSTSKQSFEFNANSPEVLGNNCDESSSDEQDGQYIKLLSSARNYMTEYSGLTPNEINKILNNNNKKPSAVKRNYTPDFDFKVSSENEKLVESKNAEKDLEIKSSTQKIITTEIMSEDSSSCDSDFVEVDSNKEVASSEKQNNTKLEILLDINEKLNEDDDLFSDVFDNMETTVHKESNILPNENIKSVISTVKDNHNCINKDQIQLEKIITLPENNEIENNSTNNVTSKISECDINIETKSTNNKDIVNVNDLDRENINPENSNKNIFEAEKELIAKKTDTELQELIKTVQPPNTTTTKESPLTTNQLELLQDKLTKDKKELLTDRMSKERSAENITDQMYKEAQELLELFGVPYIVAPMEAEAQCAFLDAIDLTDGSITDDSDIWLFGGRTVYKNFFNQNKHVMEFRSESIHNHFKLSREQLILLAMLVGSDYTTGVPGIGPVTALEILAAFPIPPQSTTETTNHPEQVLASLVQFRSWFDSGKVTAPGKTALRGKLKNCSLTDNFPSLNILHAYMDPEVEKSREQFTWGKPDLVALEDFAKEKFGWKHAKSEEVLKPVMKRMADSKSQKSIREYFKTKHKLVDGTDAKSKMSKRVKTAVVRMERNEVGDCTDSEEELMKKPQKRKVSKKKKVEEVDSELKGPEDEEISTVEQGDVDQRITTSKKRNVRKKETKHVVDGTAEQGDEDVKTTTKRKKVQKKKTENVVDGKLKITEMCTVDEGGVNERKTTNKRKKVQSKESEHDVVSERSKKLVKDKETGEIQILEDTKKISKAVSKPTTQKDEVDGSKKDSKKTVKTVAKPDERMMIIEDAKRVVKKKIEQDEEMRILQETKRLSKQKVKAVEKEIKDKIKASTSTSEPSKEPKKLVRPSLHRKETIMQREIVKSDLLRSKMKAIEVFRTSKKGPGFVKKRKVIDKLLKDDAELSESSSD